MRVLVTGGAGYIGSVTVAELLASGHDVVVYDNLSAGHRDAVAGNVELVAGDVTDRAALDSVLQRGTDAVMHFAALIEAGESMKAPERFFRTNTAGTLTLLEAMLAAGVDKIVFSSTAAVYGDPKSIPIQEDDPLHPVNVYGESKLMVERMLAWFHKIHGLHYASLRYFNAAGAIADLGEAHNPESHLIPIVLQVALGQREAISIYGTDYPSPDGTCIRDYIHVVDLARAHVLALEALESDGASSLSLQPANGGSLIFNLGNGRGFSVREVIDAARRVTGRDIPVVEAPRRPGDPAVLVASSEKIRRSLGWKPKYPELETIIRSAWEWHLAHPRGYAKSAEQKQ